METKTTNPSPEVATAVAALLAESAEAPKPWTRMRPVGSRVLVRPEMTEEKTDGGMFIPSTARKPLPQGTVVAAGSGRTLANGDVVPLAVAPGDRVVFRAKARESTVEIGSEKLVMVDEAEILGVLTEEH